MLFGFVIVFFPKFCSANGKSSCVPDGTFGFTLAVTPGFAPCVAFNAFSLTFGYADKYSLNFLPLKNNSKFSLLDSTLSIVGSPPALKSTPLAFQVAKDAYICASVILTSFKPKLRSTYGNLFCQALANRPQLYFPASGVPSGYLDSSVKLSAILIFKSPRPGIIFFFLTVSIEVTLLLG